MGTLKPRGRSRLASLGAAIAGLVLAVDFAALMGQGGGERASAHMPANTGTATFATLQTPHDALDFSVGVNTDARTATGEQRQDALLVLQFDAGIIPSLPAGGSGGVSAWKSSPG